MQNKDYPSLRECPFCGGKAKLIENTVCGGRDYSYVECESCHIRTQQYSVNVKICPNEEAIEVWNRRAENGKS